MKEPIIFLVVVVAVLAVIALVAGADRDCRNRHGVLVRDAAGGWVCLSADVQVPR